MDSAYILVIILSVLLAIFLIVGIVLVIMLIKLTMQIRSAAESARRASDIAASLLSGAKRAKDISGLVKIVSSASKKLKRNKEK